MKDPTWVRQLEKQWTTSWPYWLQQYLTNISHNYSLHVPTCHELAKEVYYSLRRGMHAHTVLKREPLKRRGKSPWYQASQKIQG
jgi:hypothetical protein